MPMGEGDEKCCLINTLTSRAAAAVVFNEAGKEKDGRGARTREGGSTFFLSPPPFGRTHQRDQRDQGSSSSACSFLGPDDQKDRDTPWRHFFQSSCRVESVLKNPFWYTMVMVVY